METFAKHYGKLWGDTKDAKAFPSKTCKKREREEFFQFSQGLHFGESAIRQCKA